MLGDEEDQEHQGSGGRLKLEVVLGVSVACGEAQWEKEAGKLPTSIPRRRLTFELTVCRPILESEIPTWREERGGLEVASEGRKKTRFGETYHAAKAEFGIEEFSSDQVFAGVGGIGTV